MTTITYPLCIFQKKQLRIVGVILSVVLLLAVTVIVFANGRTSYETEVLSNGGSAGATFDDTYTAEIIFEEGIENYMVHVAFHKTGSTQLILTAPDGSKQVFDLEVGRDTYDIHKAADSGT